MLMVVTDITTIRNRQQPLLLNEDHHAVFVKSRRPRMG